MHPFVIIGAIIAAVFIVGIFIAYVVLEDQDYYAPK